MNENVAAGATPASDAGGHVLDDECLSCGEFDAKGRPLPEGECPASKRPCGHHCNCSWIHDCCHWCGCEMGEEGEPQVGAVVAYVKGGEPHLAWREPCANQENDHHWHVFHGMAFGWRTWREVSGGDDLRFLGIHGEPAASSGDRPLSAPWGSDKGERGA